MKYSLSLREILRAQAIIHRLSRLKSQYRHSELQLQHCPSWRSILEELIFCIAPTAGQYGKILPIRLSNTGELNFNIITFRNLECIFIMTRGGIYDEIQPEPEGFPDGSGYITLYYITFPDLSHNTDILN